MICPKSIGFWVKSSGSETRIGRIRCKAWLCPVCGPINRNVLIANTINVSERLAKQGYKLWFATYTLGKWQHVSGRGKQASAAHEAFNRYWHFLRKVARRESTVEYVRFLERHESGVFHIHAIIATKFQLDAENFEWPDRRYKKREVMIKHRHKDELVRCGFGYEHEIRECENPKKAGFYATKYSTKEIMAMVEVESGFRRFASSRAYALTHKEKASVAVLVERIDAGMVLGHVVLDTDFEDRQVTIDDFIRLKSDSIGPSVDYAKTALTDGDILQNEV